MATAEPGRDRHDWETEYSALEEELATDPAAALPELADLVERILVQHGYRVVDDPVGRIGDEPDVVAEFQSAKEVAARTTIAPEACDPGDIASAIGGLRGLYEQLLAERSAP